MMLRKQPSFVVGMGVVVLLCAASHAWAQSPEYQPLGMRAGSILLFPQAVVREGYNDNVLREDSDKTGSMVTEIKPGIFAITDWEGGEIALTSGAQIGIYESSSADNYTDYFASGDATYEATPATTFFIKEVGVWHLHEARGTDDLPLTAAEPTVYDKWGGSAAALYKPSFLGVEFGGSYYDYRYDNTESTGGAAPIAGAPRDYASYAGSIKVGYDIQPGYETFVRGIYSIESYDLAVNAGGFNRDSHEYTLLAGMAYEPSPLITASIDAGYIRREYDNAALGNISGPAVNVDVVWSVTPLMTIGLQGYTKIEETTSSTAAGKLVYGTQLAIQHELLPNLVLALNVGYDKISYDGGTSNRVDNDLIGGFGATYWMAQHLFVGANYELRYRASNTAGFDYTQNVYMIKLGAQW